MGAERPGDDVPRHRRPGLSALHGLRGLELPGQRVVTRELLDPRAMDAVGPAVADVAHQRAPRQDDQRRARGAHALEVGRGIAAGVDVGVGLLDARPQGPGRRPRGELLVGQRHLFGRQGAGGLAGGVGAHAVGDHEDPAPGPVLLIVQRGEDLLRILVVGATHADVGQVAVFQAHSGSHAATAPFPGGGDSRRSVAGRGGRGTAGNRGPPGGEAALAATGRSLYGSSRFASRPVPGATQAA